MPHSPVNRLVSFYSYMMHKLAVLGARLQGFRYELTTINKIFGEMDPVKELSVSQELIFSKMKFLMCEYYYDNFTTKFQDNVFTALELYVVIYVQI